MNLECINPPGMSVGSYSHAVIVNGGRLVFLSGQVAQDASGKVTADTFEGQVEQVFDSLTTVLAASGAQWTDVVKMTVYLCDINPERVRIFRELRGRRLAGHKPASTLIGTSGLVHEKLMLEVELVARLPEAQVPG
jgi:2-iminobutanoate/2-iminopropanoate deaminase